MVTYKSCLYLFLFMLLACQGPKRNLHENTVVAHLAFKTNGLHPTNDIDANRALIFKFTQRNLLEIDLRNNNHVSTLLEQLPQVSPDGTHIVFTLRRDVKWDDGTSFTAEDAVFSLKILVCPLLNNPSYKSTYLSVFKSISLDSLNPFRFTFINQGFHRSNLDLFADIFMLEKKKWDPEGCTDAYSVEDFMSAEFKATEKLQQWAAHFNNPATFNDLKNLGGLGPYTITQWEPDSYLILQKKKNWWGDKDTFIQNQNRPEKIVFKLILDESSMVYALKNEKLDVVNKITTTKLLKLRNHDYFNKCYFSAFTRQYAYTYICLNAKPDGLQHKPFFTNKNVRRAIAHLVPVDDIIKIFSKGQSTRMVTCVYPQKKEHHPGLKPIPYDVQKAIALLEQAGWKDTDGDNIRDKVINGEKIKFSFTLNYPNIVPGNKEICALIKDCMYQAGVEMIPNGLDFAQFYQECYNQTFDASLGSWLGGSAYEDFSQLFSTASWANHGENFGGFGNAKTDSLLATINKEKNETKYLQLMHAFQEIIYDEQPYVFLMSPQNKIVMHKRFSNPHAYEEKPNFYLNALHLNTSSKILPE